MKIVVIGGTGLIGSKLVSRLRADGHDPLAASPNSGVDIITGKGLAEALAGAQVVVDVSNAPAWDDAAVMDFFQTSARNILAAETAAGTGHHVALSVVGTDRLPLECPVLGQELVHVGGVLRQAAQRVGRRVHGEAALPQPGDDAVPARGVRPGAVDKHDCGLTE